MQNTVEVRVTAEMDKILTLLEGVDAFPGETWTEEHLRCLKKWTRCRSPWKRMTPERIQTWIGLRQGKVVYYELPSWCIDCSLEYLLNAWPAIWRFIYRCSFEEETTDSAVRLVNLQKSEEYCVRLIVQALEQWHRKLYPLAGRPKNLANLERRGLNDFLIQRVRFRSDEDPCSSEDVLTAFLVMDCVGANWEDLKTELGPRLFRLVEVAPLLYLDLKDLKYPIDDWLRYANRPRLDFDSRAVKELTLLLARSNRGRQVGIDVDDLMKRLGG